MPAITNFGFRKILAKHFSTSTGHDHGVVGVINADDLHLQSLVGSNRVKSPSMGLIIGNDIKTAMYRNAQKNKGSSRHFLTALRIPDSQVVALSIEQLGANGYVKLISAIAYASLLEILPEPFGPPRGYDRSVAEDLNV
ncbi:hypothetical protein JCM31598_25880 [Desulfonatronum parangueonense]